HPGRSGVICLTRYLNPPPSVRPDPVADRDGTAEVDQTAPLLDVQLNERPDAPKRRGIRPGRLRWPPGCSHPIRHGDPVGVTQVACPIRAQHTGDHPGSGTGNAEPGTFLVDGVHYLDAASRQE